MTRKKDRKPHPFTKTDRNAAIWQAVEVEKKSHTEVGAELGISGARVGQILAGMRQKKADEQAAQEAAAALPKEFLAAHHAAPADD